MNEGASEGQHMFEALEIKSERPAHAQGRHGEYIGRRMPGWRPRGRPKRRFMDGVKEDTKVVGVREEDAGER